MCSAFILHVGLCRVGGELFALLVVTVLSPINEQGIWLLLFVEFWT